MGLRWRIVLPFAALFVALFAAITWVASAQVVRAVEGRLTVQAENLATLLTRSPGMDASPAILGHIQKAYDAEVAIEVGGEPVRGTLPAAALRLLGKADIRRETGLLQPVRLDQDYLVAWSRIPPNRGLYLLYSPEIVSEEKNRALIPVIAVAGIGLLLVGVLAYVTAWTIARPVERLAVIAREVSSGKLDVEIPPVHGGSEIDRLVIAFRNMVDGLRRYQEELVKSKQLAVLGQMAAGIAHEIRNPLSAMKMTVQMMREDAAPEKREPCDVILREIDRLDLAVAEIFSAAHPSPLQKEPVRLSELAEEVLKLLHPQLDHLSVRVKKRYESQSTVSVDRNIFKRAVMNLILNGAQSMPGGGELVVGTSGSNGKPRFYVKDAGQGIAEEHRSRIFEPFFSSKPGGMGLGLAVTKRIVEDHGGEIGFETSSKGSTFWVDLPGEK